MLYSIVLIIDLIMNCRKIQIGLLTVNFAAYGNIINVNPVIKQSLVNICINYFLSFFVIYIMRGLLIEKGIAIQLNDELTNANEKLREYSEKIEERCFNRTDHGYNRGFSGTVRAQKAKYFTVFHFE